MTHHHLMDRPIPRAVGSFASGPVLAGVTSALAGLATIAVPVVVLWVLSPYPQDTAADATRLVGGLWLLSHGGPLYRGQGAVPLSLTPLLLTVLTVLLLRGAGARAARAAGGRVAGVSGSVCAGYLAVALPVALACSSTGALRSRPLPDLLAVAVLSYASAALGARAVPGRTRWPVLRRRLARWTPSLPAAVRPAGGAAQLRRAAAAAVLTLPAGGAVLLAVAVPLRSDAVDLTMRELTGGSVSGSSGLVLTCLLLVPNAVVWSCAYALGAGFLLGTGTAVEPGRVVLGAVPDFPLFALVPGTASAWQRVAFAVPVLAGAVVAVLLGRAAAHGGQLPPGQGSGAEVAADGPSSAVPWPAAATVVAATGTALAAGVVVAAAGWLAGGALGAGRMAELGPSPWRVGVAAAGWFVGVAAPGALVLRWWLPRRTAGDEAWAPAVAVPGPDRRRDGGARRDGWGRCAARLGAVAEGAQLAVRDRWGSTATRIGAVAERAWLAFRGRWARYVRRSRTLERSPDED